MSRGKFSKNKVQPTTSNPLTNSNEFEEGRIIYVYVTNQSHLLVILLHKAHCD